MPGNSRAVKGESVYVPPETLEEMKNEGFHFGRSGLTRPYYGNIGQSDDWRKDNPGVDCSTCKHGHDHINAAGQLIRRCLYTGERGRNNWECTAWTKKS